MQLWRLIEQNTCITGNQGGESPEHSYFNTGSGQGSGQCILLTEFVLSRDREMHIVLNKNALGRVRVGFIK